MIIFHSLSAPAHHHATCRTMSATYHTVQIMQIMLSSHQFTIDYVNRSPSHNSLLHHVI